MCNTICDFLCSLRHHLQLGCHLCPSHQQCLKSHLIHADDEFLQRTGGGFALSVAEETHSEKRPQKPHLFHHFHGNVEAALLPAAVLPPAGVPDRWRSSVRLTREHFFGWCHFILNGSKAWLLMPLTRQQHCFKGPTFMRKNGTVTVQFHHVPPPSKS